MDPSVSDRNPVDELAEEFVERYRRGERPSLSEYTQKYPHWAAEIPALFPALVIMEKVRPDVADTPIWQFDLNHEQVKPSRLGDYRILREVGRGGMGIVYEAEQESLGRHVALKVLAGHSAIDQRRLHRFQREARASARLHHTNIVPVYGVGEQDGVYYYVMQFIQGLGLDAVLDELQRLRGQGKAHPSARVVEADEAADNRTDPSAANVAEAMLTGQFPPAPSRPSATLSEVESPLGSLPPACQTAASDSGSISAVHLPGQSAGSSLSEAGREYWRSVARIGLQVAEALGYASSQGVLHRDIKPSNLLLDTHGTVWVTDFGLAKAEDDDNLTRTGDIIGTLRYLAPECLGGQADARSDLYSLGLTLYELLTLRPAFDESERGRLIRQVLHDTPSRPRQLDPTVPRDLETIVLKATARAPAHRYQNAAELADDLQRFLDDRPIRARQVSAVQRGWRWCRRKPALASLSAAVAGLLLAIAIGSSLGVLRLKKEQSRLEHEQGQTLIQLRRAETAEKAAVKAERQALDRLWDSNLAQAQARRWSGQPGRHFKSLAALAEAAQMRPALELRNEAAACIPLVDLQPTQVWVHNTPYRDQPLGIAFDGTLKRYAISDEKGTVSIRLVDDNSEIASLAGFGVFPNNIQFSPNGDLLVIRYGETKLSVWDLTRAASILEIAMPPGPSGYAAQLFTSDSRRLLVGLGDKTLRTYDLFSAQEMKRYTLDAAVASMALNRDGQRLAVVGWGQQVVTLLDAETGTNLAPLPQAGPIDVAWHPDGSLLAVAYGDRAIQLWDADTGQKRALLTGHQNVPRQVVFNHAGDLLVSWAWDGTTRLWDTISGKEMVSIPGFFVRFASDDSQLSFVRGWEVGIWQVATGRQYRTLYAPDEHGYGPDHVAVDPSGRLLVTSHDDGTRLWSLPTGTHSERLPVGRGGAVFEPTGESLLVNANRGLQRWPITFNQRDGTVRVGPPKLLRDAPAQHYGGISISRDGRWLALMVGRQDAMVVDLEQPEEVVPLGPHAAISTVTISPNGRWVATGTQFGSGIKIWDARRGTLVEDLPAGSYSSSCFSPNGKWLVTNSNGEGVHLREVGSWTVRFHLSNEPSAASFSPDGSLLAVRSGSTIVLIDPSCGEELVRLSVADTVGIGPMSFSADNALLAAACPGQHRTQLFDVSAVRRQLSGIGLDWQPPLERKPDDSGPASPIKVRAVHDEREIARLDGHTHNVSGVMFSPDGKTLASVSEDNTVKLWGVANGRLLRTLYGHAKGVISVNYSPDGRTLVSTGRDARVIFWDTDTGQSRLVLSDHQSMVEAAAFSPDGQLLATGSSDGALKIREADTGAILHTFQHAHQVVRVAFSGDGRTLVSCGGSWEVSDDLGEVRIWNLDTRQQRLAIPGRFGGIWGMALSEDERTIAGACLDGTVRLWDVDTGENQRILSGHSDRSLWVAFSPDGSAVVSSGFDGTIRAWDLATLTERDRLLGHVGNINRCAFSPDGHILASAGHDRSIRLWRFGDTAAR